MARLEEIQRLLNERRSINEIALTLRCRKQTVVDVKRQLLTAAMIEHKQDHPRLPPAWATRVDWVAVEAEIVKGFEIKRIWEEYASTATSHSNFFKYMKKRFELLLIKTVTLRQFNAGEHSEVDYAGDRIEWMDQRGEVHEAQVFIAILCYSQLIFAHASENQKKENWLDAHRKFFERLGGVPQVVVPDNLKAAVTRAHLYDPDLNPDYTELAKHYGVSVVPARVRHPKDKALVEGAVKLVMRLFKWTYRRHTFLSIEEINQGLALVTQRINEKKHSRFGVSRQHRFDTDEKSSLKTLPIEPWASCTWKACLLHPDCTVGIERNYYSAPYQLRGQELRVKLSHSQVEIFHDLKREALHHRVPAGKVGIRVLEPVHLPPNARAYLEATPQNLLSQSKFVHPKLHELIEHLFEQDVLGNLRRAQGLIRKAHTLVQLHGSATAAPWISRAVDHMMRFNQIRVVQFDSLIREEQKKRVSPEDRTIVRKPGNPMLRRVGLSTGTTPLSDSK